MPDANRDDVDQRHRQEDFPGEPEQLIDTDTRPGAADPDVQRQRVGRGGQRIDDAWNDGAQAYLGITTAGFSAIIRPNLAKNQAIEITQPILGRSQPGPR